MTWLTFLGLVAVAGKGSWLGDVGAIGDAGISSEVTSSRKEVRSAAVLSPRARKGERVDRPSIDVTSTTDGKPAGSA